MKRPDTPPPLPNGRLRQIDLDAAVEEILQGLLKERACDEIRAKAADAKLEHLLADTHHLGKAMGDLRERTGRSDAFTHRAAGELLKIGHRSEALLEGTAFDASASYEMLKEIVRRVQRIEANLASDAPTPFEKEMREAFRELSLPAPLPPPLPPPLPADADDGVSDGPVEIPFSPEADNVVRFVPAARTGGFDAVTVTTKAMKRANGPMRAVAIACAALLATVAFAGSDSGHGRSGAPQATRCRYPAAADALPAQDAQGRQVVLCDGEPSVVLRRNANGTVQFGPYES